MRDDRLAERAAAAGLAASYRDWRGNQATVPAKTLEAILAALGETGRPGAPGQRKRPAAPGPARLPTPSGRLGWGFTVQLYGLRSRDSWGHGDFRDLAGLATWSARELGAAFVLINPLHAAEPLPPVSPSPYLPMSRAFTSPLYLRVEDIAEYDRLPAAGRARIAELAAPLRAQNGSAALIDRDAVWAAKRQALEIVHQAGLSPGRRASFGRFREREGAPLADWAAWCALAERHGPDWRAWPTRLRNPAAARDEYPDRAAFHAWLQWVAAEQRAAAQRAARRAGMPIGIIGDLAVGVHPGGADPWAGQDLYLHGLTTGAPPDEFNQRGQDWNQPPPHPWRLAETGYQPLAELLRAAVRDSGGLRVDHVMGLARLWCIPAGMPPDRGAYLRYDHRLGVGALTGAAAEAGALAIGEDLGTVEPWIRGYLARHGVLGTMMAWFARTRSGAPLPPRRWRRACMATVGTHDMPPVAGFLSGEQVAVRERLGLLKDPEGVRSAARLMLARWRDALLRHHAAPAAADLAAVGEFTVAMYAYLARTPSALIGVSLADAVGELRSQNIPGTTGEYPNWQIPLCDGEGREVLLEDLPAHPQARRVARAAAGRTPNEHVNVPLR
jgi:4-alpha-glucanotransferase